MDTQLSCFHPRAELVHHLKTTVPLSVLMPTALMPGWPSTHRRGSLLVPIHSSVAFLSPASSIYSMPSGFTLWSAGLCMDKDSCGQCASGRKLNALQ